MTTLPPQGYRSAAYAAALAEMGRPVPLEGAGGVLLERAIPGTELTDLASPYPLLCCGDWSRLDADLRGLGRNPVAVTLVVDPFCPLPPERLAAMFPVCRPLHDHYLVDLAARAAPSRHHRRKIREGAGVRLEAGPADPRMAEDWARLYAGLVERRGIRDLRRFGDASLRRQLEVPGAHLVTAWEGDRMIGADLYYLDSQVAYAHLSAYAAAGYARSVSYAMMAHAIDHFRDRARFLDLGGVPTSTEGSGLHHFKSGWTALTRPSHLCGRVLDPVAYESLRSRGRPGSGYFPPYREGEFG